MGELLKPESGDTFFRNTWMLKWDYVESVLARLNVPSSRKKSSNDACMESATGAT